MAGTYELWLTDDRGVRLADSQGRTLLSNVINGTFQRVDNGVGRFSMQMPVSFDTNLIQADQMVQVWRKPQDVALGSLWRTYFIRWWRYARTGSDLFVEIRGVDVNDLLRRRRVINSEDTIYATYSDHADDLMKYIVTNNLVTDASDPAPTAGSRVVPDFTVQPDASASVTLYKSFQYAKVLDIVQQLQRDSRNAGIEAFWQIKEISVGPPLLLEFQTRINQPGADHTDVIFDEARGNLVSASETNDWMSEENYIYGGGQGVAGFRVIEQAYDSSRYGISRYARSEGFAYASPGAAANVVLSAARDTLIRHRNLRIFEGRIVDTAGTRFGRDWNWGDRVTARFLDREGEAIIRQVILSIDERGQETIDAPLEYVE